MESGIQIAVPKWQDERRQFRPGCDMELSFAHQEDCTASTPMFTCVNVAEDLVVMSQVSVRVGTESATAKRSAPTRTNVAVRNMESVTVPVDGDVKTVVNMLFGKGERTIQIQGHRGAVDAKFSGMNQDVVDAFEAYGGKWSE